jgi:SAM-dependent methyltransferase
MRKGCLRNKLRQVTDFLTFPIRAITLFENDLWGLSSLASERYDYVAREVGGYCLDVGCGPNNKFINSYLNGHGIGIDVYPYEGLTADNLIDDINHFPFPDLYFDTVTFIANLNHVPKSQRDIELSEAYRCLKHAGNIVVTMGNPVAEILVHKLVYGYDRFLGTKYDRDSERGMHPEEEYFLTDTEIRQRLVQAGFKEIVKKYFWTQWAMNHMLIGWKR